ncbi:uncharacterized protein LOC128883353 [Hylaeus volcanicus]|uniref:uncharacterized protein LOC128883353 n=1 Tax=Hylaeus volcanicus TaxID=313075 RepID=UPI0023B77F8C|nr:uncharacterized protein LOC128883353 [Hylaeus volcanicus]
MRFSGIVRFINAGRFLQRLPTYHAYRKFQTKPSCQRAFSTGSKTNWKNTAAQHRWAPEILDNQYYWEHPIYTGFLLWIRGIRPYIEKLFQDSFLTSKSFVLNILWLPYKNFLVRHNPDIRLKIIYFTSFFFTIQTINIGLSRWYQSLMDMKRNRTLQLVKESEDSGFFNTQMDDDQYRRRNYQADHERLSKLWETALQNASKHTEDCDAGFAKLCSYIVVPLENSNITTPKTWTFDLIPYGKNNRNTKTFPIPFHEQPHRAFAFNTTYTNLVADWGDYIDRLDNKQATIRPTRIMFTDVFIPPTK